MLSWAVSMGEMATLSYLQPRRAPMEHQLSLLESLLTPGSVALWRALDEDARAPVRRLLARLIAQAILAPMATPSDTDPEGRDE
jgi:hypothetical protein